VDLLLSVAARVIQLFVPPRIPCAPPPVNPDGKQGPPPGVRDFRRSRPYNPVDAIARQTRAMTEVDVLKRVALGALALGGGAALIRRLLYQAGIGGQRRHASQSEAEYREAKTRILILGGGFGGISTALKLDKLLKNNHDTSVLVVDRDNSTLFTPLLWPVANGTASPNSVVVPIRAFQRNRNFHVLHAQVERIDLEDRVVYVSGAQARPYDVLVIALGSVTQVPNLPGLRERALLFASPADALTLRNRLIDAIERAHRALSAEERRAALTFVVGGGGDTGVEVAATIWDYLESGLLAEYPWLADEQPRVVVVGRSDRLVSTSPERVSRAVQRSLETKGIEVQVGSAILSVTDTAVYTSNGEIPAHTIFWAAGTSAPVIVRDLPVEKARNGAIMVDDHLRMQEYPNVYVIGDSGWAYDARTGDPLPPTAQAAEQQGTYVAKLIAASLEGRDRKAYSPRSLGHLVLLGRHAGVAHIGPLTFTGLPAWLLWHAYYLSHIPSWRNRIFLLTGWLLAALTGRETSQLRLDAGRRE